MLVPCRECRALISEYARTCPHCGVGEPTYTAWRRHVREMDSDLESKLKRKIETEEDPVRRNEWISILEEHKLQVRGRGW